MTEKLKVNFGDKFKTREDGIIVVIGLSEGISTADVVEISRKEALSMSGTPCAAELTDLIENWGLERILNALANYIGDTEPIGRYYDLIRNEARQEPKIIS